jgi:hypothetical protein
MVYLDFGIYSERIGLTCAFSRSLGEARKLLSQMSSQYAYELKASEVSLLTDL